jgi:hypothetical protein
LVSPHLSRQQQTFPLCPKEVVSFELFLLHVFPLSLMSKRQDLYSLLGFPFTLFRPNWRKDKQANTKGTKISFVPT